MRKGLAGAVLVAAIIAIGTTAPAFARGGGGGGGGGASAGHGGFSSSGLPAGFSQGQKQGWGGGTTPPGWTGHGQKTGWGSGTMPPGLSGR